MKTACFLNALHNAIVEQYLPNLFSCVKWSFDCILRNEKTNDPETCHHIIQAHHVPQYQYSTPTALSSSHQNGYRFRGVQLITLTQQSCREDVVPELLSCFAVR